MTSPETTAPPRDQPDPGTAYTVTDIAIIAGVISAAALILICLLLVLLRYQCQHKGTYYTNEDKGTEFAETVDVALALEADSSKKEYFI